MRLKPAAIRGMPVTAMEKRQFGAAGQPYHQGGATTSAFVVATEDLPRAKAGRVDDPSVRWAGAFATYGGHGATQSSTIVYEIEPGGRLGRPLFFHEAPRLF